MILIPDGRLAQIPWAALPGKAPNTYLLEDFDLAQASYGQQVARILADAPTVGNGFLLLGGRILDRLANGAISKGPSLK